MTTLLRRRRPTEEQPTTNAGAVLPSAGPVEVMPRFVRVGDGFCATLAVTGYPAEVGAAWLEPLLSWRGRLDVALHL
jgi:hypothetical protein